MCASRGSCWYLIYLRHLIRSDLFPSNRPIFLHACETSTKINMSKTSLNNWLRNGNDMYNEKHEITSVSIFVTIKSGSAKLYINISKTYQNI